MTSQAAAGWYFDPLSRFERRYWDGSQWTHHVWTGGRQGLDPPTGPPGQTAPAARPPAGWYPDPAGLPQRRYWDGGQWTPQVQPHVHHGSQPGPPLTAPSSATSSSGSAAHGAASGGTLFDEQVLVINQKVKLFGSKMGYGIYRQDGQQLGTIQEVRRDLKTTLGDDLRGRGSDSRRTYRFRVIDVNKRVLLEMTRPRKGWLKLHRALVVDGPSGAPVGRIVQKSYGTPGQIATAAHTGVQSATAITMVGIGGLTGLAAGAAVGTVQGRLDAAVEGLDKVGHARFSLEADGHHLASVHAEDTTAWDFNVQDPSGTEIARITKTWAGWAKERFTKADNYLVILHGPVREPLRTLVIAAALAIDVELKEFGDQTSGSSLFGTRRYR